jgi:hypothetical protein
MNNELDVGGPEPQVIREPPKPMWHHKFQTGELLPWKGTWFKVEAVLSDGLQLTFHHNIKRD